MTSTSAIHGFREHSRNSSRVLKPPGGGVSSDIFGTIHPQCSSTTNTNVDKSADSSVFMTSPEPSSRVAQRTARDGSYNPLTGKDYKDLAPNHHALHVKELPKPQLCQPALPCSDDVYQAKGGKMHDIQTATRITNPPGGKTRKLW